MAATSQTLTSVALSIPQELQQLFRHLWSARPILESLVMLLNGYFVSDFHNVESVAKDLSKAV
jgi:hypothetical protein